MPRLLQFFFFSLLLHLTVSAQSPYLSAYTTAQGLPNNNVTCLLQDKQGFLWVGTTNGLCRFDGTHFYTFPPGIFESNRIAGDLILDLEEDGEHIWASHRFGATRIDKHSFDCKNYQSPEAGNKYQLQRAIRDICKDPNGNLWFAGSSQLMLYDKKKDLLLEVVNTGQHFRNTTTQVSKIVSDGGNRIYLLMVEAWAAFDLTLKKLDTTLNSRIPVKYLRGENIRLRSYWNTFPSNHNLRYEPATGMLILDAKKHIDGINSVKNFYVDDDQNVFVNTEGNEVQTWTSQGVILPGLSAGPSDSAGKLKEFNCSRQIAGRQCWGSPQGLLVPDKNNDYVLRYFFSQKADAQFKRQEDIMDVKEFDDTRLLVSTRRGLYFMDKLAHSLTHFPYWKDSAVYCSLVMPDNSVWLSLGNQLVHCNLKSGRINRRIPTGSYCVAILAGKNRLVAATRSDGLLLADLAGESVEWLKENDSLQQLIVNRITSVKALQEREYLITYNDTVGAYSVNNFDERKFVALQVPRSATVFGENFVVTTTISVNRQAWFGHYIGGISLFDSVPGKWINFSTQNGLSSNNISQLLYDQQKRVWIITEQGIDVYDNQSKVINHFPLSLQTGGRTGGFVSRTGKLILFDKANIMEVDPARFSTTAGGSKILFSQVLQDRSQLRIAANTLRLPYNQNSFSIIFSLLKFEPGRSTHYAYRLRENDEWTAIGAETELSFASLQPGKYKLQIRATDEFGQWSHYSEILTVEIKPPYWKTAWFYILLGIVLSVGLWLVYRYRINQLKRIHQLRQKISQDLHDEVGATLSGVTLMSELVMEKMKSGLGADTHSYMERIAGESKDMARKMNDIVWAINPRNDSLEKVISKIQAYAIPVCASRHIRFHPIRPDEQPAMAVSMLQRNNIYLICKEAINNAVKHSGAVNIWFSIEKKQGETCITIRDDGEGFELDIVKEGEGLQNMKTRADEIKARFRMTTGNGKGTLVQLWFI